MTANLGNYTTPEDCFKMAEELYKGEGNWQEALVMLHIGIQNRKTKQNMIILEKLMMFMIDICTEQLTSLYLREDLGYFRNLCQHQSMNLLEKILGYLRTKSEKVLAQLEKDYGLDTLTKYLGDDQGLDPSENQATEQEASSEELIFLAYTSLNSIEEKNKIMPRANYFLEISKNILDTLRLNSKLLEFYNDTARKVFMFCKKYKNRKEYRRISETLHTHF